MSSDQEVRLNAVLDWLAKGRLTTEQAARRIKTMKFAPMPDKTVFQQQYAAANGDPEPPQAGSFFAISDAYAAGKINRDQYADLAAAAAESMKSVSGA